MTSCFLYSFYLLHAVSLLSVKFITNLFWCCEPYISSGSFIKLSSVINQPISLRVCTTETRNSLIIHLMTLSVAHTIFRIINCKGYARKRYCPNLRYRRSICLLTLNIVKDNLPPGLNQGFSLYKAGRWLLTSLPWCFFAFKHLWTPANI
jgi:hypothetical protein